MDNTGGTKLYCFSPPVMMATFLIEVSLFLYVFVRYRLTPITRIVSAILILLALFQIAEYNVCQVSPAASVWSRVGFVAITLLPALGIHLIVTIAQRKWRWLVGSVYLTSLVFIIIFSFSKTAFVGHACNGNYAIFQLANDVGGAYYVYYYAWLLTGILLSLYLSYYTKNKVREALLLQVVGYLVFLLPTMVVNNFSPQAISGVPSVMCGFAILYALILVFGIVPMTVSKSVKI